MAYKNVYIGKGGEIKGMQIAETKIANVQVTPSAIQSKRWFQNLLVFFAPLGIIYLSAIAALLQTEGHIFNIQDFMPTSFQWGAIVLYGVNAILDYLRKVRAS